MGSEKTAERARREQSSAIASSLFEASPLATALLDGDLRCVLLNPAFAAMGGIAADDAPGRPLGEVVPHLSSLLQPILRTTLDTQLPFTNMEIRAGAPESARRYLVSSFLVRDAGIAGPAVGVTLVERAARDEEARRDEPIFRTIFERAAIGIAMFEWQGKSLGYNPAFCAMLGYTEEEIARIGVQALTHPDDFAADLELFRRLMAGEIDHYRLSKRYLRKDGRVMWGQLLVSLSRDAEGRPSLIICMIEDVTDRKLADEERARLILELEDALRSREVFLTVASHELRTPLTSLLLNLQVFQRKVGRAGGSISPEVAKAVRSTERLTSLVETLIGVSKIAAGRFTPELATIDLQKVARDLVERFQPTAELAGCSLSLHAPEPVLARADVFQIAAVLHTLLANAVKFGPNAPIELEVTRGEGVMRLAVRDHGIGIAPEDLERIFQRFARRVSETQYGGLGLGLYVARRIVELHGGRIWVESEPGAGATFFMELPSLE